jgi:hypothetical protein
MYMQQTTTELQQFYGFYMQKPFWTLSKPNFTETSFYQQFSGKMSEVMVEFNEQYYTLRFCRDGLIMFSSKFQNLDFTHVLEYLNALSVIIESEMEKWTFSSFTPVIELNSKHVIPHTIENTTIRSYNSSRNNSETLHQYHGRFLEYYLPLDYKKLNWNDVFWPGFIKHTVQVDARIKAREGRVLSLEQCTQINNTFKRLVSNYNSIMLLAQMTKAIDQFQNGHYDISVIMSWFIIESYIFTLYQNRVLQGLSTIEQEISSSEILKILQQRKILSYDFVGDIHKIRIMRNQITHNTFEAKTTATEALLALAIIQQFIRQDIAIDIELKYI